MAHILLPTDFSGNALNAAIHAVRLFGDEGNTFTAVHSFSSDADGDAGVLPSVDPVAAIAAELTDQFVERIRAGLPGRRPVVHSVSGPGPLTDLIKVVQHEGNAPDVVVMGTQGASGLLVTLLGSHTADMIRNSDLPVLTIPEKAVFKMPKHIVLADDGGPVDKAMLRILLTIARSARSEVMIVGTSDQETTSEHGSTSSAYDVLLGGIPHTHQYLSGDNMQNALSELADQSDADLVAFPHRPSGLFQHLFHKGPITGSVLHTHVPLLVLRPPKG